MLSRVARNALCTVGLRPASARAMGSATWTTVSLDGERDHLPTNVYVPEGGRRVSTPDIDPVRHSLMEPDHAVHQSLLDPQYHAHSSAKTFGGWDPRSYGNSLGSSLRDPAYDQAGPAGPAVLPHRRTARRS